MITLKTNARGQVTLRKRALKHLGVSAGGKLELDLLPVGRVMLRRRPAGSIEDFFGLLARKTKKVATIEEMNEAAAAGWAGQVRIRGRKRNRLK